MDRNFYLNNGSNIILQSISDNDLGFLFELYATSRADEMAMSGWDNQEIHNFLKMQFDLQHTQYMKNYSNPSFDLIKLDGIPVGRLYVNRDEEDIRIIDIAILPSFRRNSIAKTLMYELIKEAEEKKISLSLHVEQNNQILDWYKKIGFKPVRDVGIYHFMIRT